MHTAYDDKNKKQNSQNVVCNTQTCKYFKMQDLSHIIINVKLK